ncbi:MAG: T9SS type A sorting domain-containing protein [Candidatus Absconditabacterales bacterium]|jgi:hypothetical protein
MKKKLFLFAYIIGISIFNFAQTCEWAKSIGDIGNDAGYSINVVDKSGDIYVTGIFSGTVNFNPTNDSVILISKGCNDIFLSKYSSSGKLIWAKSFGGPGDDKGLNLTIDDSSNVYLTGYFSDTINFNSANDLNQITLTSKGGKDILISKYSQTGKLIYAKSFGGHCDDWGIGVTIDHTNNVYLTGSFNDIVDFNPNPKLKSDSDKVNLISTGNNDIFLVKYSQTEKLIYAKNIGGIGPDWGHNITIDATNNLYLTGVFSNTINLNSDFDSSKINLTSNGSYDIFLIKYSQTGKLIYAKNFGGVGDDKGLSLVTDDSLNIYLTGYFSNEVNFNPDDIILKSNGKTDIFLIKYSEKGKLLYAKSFGGPCDDWGVSVAVDKSFIYLTGGFDNKINFNPDPKSDSASIKVILKSNGKTDIFLIKYSSSGKLIYAKNFGGVGNDWGNGVVIDHLENIYLTGSFNYIVDFNPGLSSVNLISKGKDDIFISKYNNLTTNISRNEIFTTFKIYPNPAKTFLFLSSPKPTDIKIYNSVGKLCLFLKNILTEKISISNLSPGVYLIEIQQDNKRGFRKLIIY